MAGAATFNAIADAMAEVGRKAVLAARKADAERPIGTEGIALDVTDQRKDRYVQVHGDQWAVWKVRWDGKRWAFVKRLSAGNTYAVALERVRHWCAELDLPRVD